MTDEQTQAQLAAQKLAAKPNPAMELLIEEIQMLEAENKQIKAERDRLAAALRQIASSNLHNIPGVTPDGSVSSQTMAQTIARALGPDPDREPHPTPRNLWEQP